MATFTKQSVESELQALFTTFTSAAAEVIKKHTTLPPPMPHEEKPSLMPPAPVETKPEAPKPPVRRTFAPKKPTKRAHRRNDIQMTQQALLVAAAVCGHPKGVGIAELMDELHASHTVVASSLKRAKEQGLIKQNGTRRAAKYYPEVGRA